MMCRSTSMTRYFSPSHKLVTRLKPPAVFLASAEDSSSGSLTPRRDEFTPDAYRLSLITIRAARWYETYAQAQSISTTIRLRKPIR
jgi:hypothetical protein